jgi:hypothetical protein
MELAVIGIGGLWCEKGRAFEFSTKELVVAA